MIKRSAESQKIHDDIRQNKFFAAIGYIWILCLLPLLGRQSSKFALFHGRQGFLLFALSLGLWILSWFPWIGWLIWLVGSVILAALALSGVFFALRGEYWKMPVLGSYAKKITL
ncbi:hypothetical protein EPN90_03710 [Patescibacteria group bacterium]|nr:MAG: hypothetical protein EPN90_03710 [Patescibacteria group bacterium]